MCMIRDPLLEFQLRPAELPSRFDIPCPLLGSQFRLQDDHILSPADGHGLSQHFRCALIGTIELPHPAQVPGGEAGGVRVCAAQILRRGNSGAFLWPAADQPANLTVQFHLGQVCRHQRIQRREHGAVVNRFSDVHSGFSLVSGKMLFTKLLTQRLRPVYGQAVVWYVTGVKADDIVVALYVLCGLPDVPFPPALRLPPLFGRRQAL